MIRFYHQMHVQMCLSISPPVMDLNRLSCIRHVWTPVLLKSLLDSLAFFSPTVSPNSVTINTTVNKFYQVRADSTHPPPAFSSYRNVLGLINS